ncbi:adenosylcobinamide-GDP ribazoletransferase [Solibacillus sp. MA9]|uniref:Adenosylcobinamide-GDP ribazoletransferase n=1 Tax=Solibacillus palustris TaxID=2908203 RepID=A0ABS9U9Y1_9BACL|nr:adenosylcobinamide-GDP ribazoletransferase [Solibacillus sp. MA9]
MSRLKNASQGFLLAWQFFSFIPIKKQLDMNKSSITWMYASLPLVGLVIGAMISCGAYLLVSYSDISNLLLSILLVIGMVIFTGGLHLDGFIDMCDAFFSYGDKDKRLQVLDDPRTGAFGVLGIVSLLLLKLGFVYETLAQGQLGMLVYIVIIPYIARIGMLVYFVTMNTSKKTGLAAYFKEQVVRKQLIIYSAVLFTLMSAALIYTGIYSFFILVAIMLAVVVIYRKWSYRNFGGMSGDLLGALGESLEVVLWLTALLCI